MFKLILKKRKFYIIFIVTSIFLILMYIKLTTNKNDDLFFDNYFDKLPKEYGKKKNHYITIDN